MHLGTGGDDPLGRGNKVLPMNKLLSLSLSLSVSFGLLSPALAQDVRDMSTPTNYSWYYGASAATITNAIQNGYRPVDILRRTEADMPGDFFRSGVDDIQLA